MMIKDFRELKVWQKSHKLILKIYEQISFCRSLVISFLFLTLFSPFDLPSLYARSVIVNNFDNVKGTAISWKDEKGSLFKISYPNYNSERGNVLSIKYKIVKEGWGGCAVLFDSFNASSYAQITFLIRSDKGGENFEIGLKDKNQTEKKVVLSKYIEPGEEWLKVRIPLSDFFGVNLASLENFNFGFSSESEGTIYIDDIQFEIPDEGSRETQRGGSLVSKVVVDNFERANQTDLYLVYTGDDSTLSLYSSRIVTDGDYSLELEYKLSTTRTWGSWVSAHWQARETTLDWRGAKEVKLRVKGDGSGNFMRFMIIDGDGEKWIYDDPEILKATRWGLMSMPISKFRLMTGYAKKNSVLDLYQVRAYAIMIVGAGGSDTTSGAKTTVGRIQVDQLYLIGDQMNAVWAVPPKVAETEKVRLMKIGNIEFNGLVFTEYTNTPEQKSNVSHWGKLIANGKVGNYSAKIEIASEGQEFGDAAYYNLAQSTMGGTVATTQNSKEVQVNLQGFANNISPYLTQVTVGNLFVDYSPYTFSPLWGYKGLSAEGDADLLNYHFFVLKHKYDSFTLGSRIKTLWHGLRFTGISVYYREMAKINSSASVSDGTVKTATDLRLEEVQNDWVYTAELEQSLFEDKITLNGTAGYNKYVQLASADRADPYNPVFINPLISPLTLNGYIVKGKASFSNVLIKGLKLVYEYRTVDTHFRPRYCQSPVYFEDTDGDQRGYNARMTQTWRGFQASFEYDKIRRNSNSVYYRDKVSWGIGYSGFDKMDISFNQRVRRETYSFLSSRTNVSFNKNEREMESEIYVRMQCTPRLIIIVKPVRKDIVHPETGLTFADESLFGRGEFYATSNLKMIGEFKTTHFGVKTNEPQGVPYDDNYLKMNIEFSF